MDWPYIGDRKDVIPVRTSSQTRREIRCKPTSYRINTLQFARKLECKTNGWLFLISFICDCSSIGRASDFQSECCGIVPRQSLHTQPLTLHRLLRAERNLYVTTWLPRVIILERDVAWIVRIKF